MSMYPRLLGIAAVVFGFGLSEALPAGDVWKGSWKFEIDRQDNPIDFGTSASNNGTASASGATFQHLTFVTDKMPWIPFNER